MSETTLYENHKFENLKVIGQTLSDYKFIECEFNNCYFEECTLENCTFINCKFNKTNIITLKSKNSESKYSEFQGCNLIGINWNNLLPKGMVAEPIRSIKESLLKYNYFIEMKMQKFDFSKNNILESLFENCDLRESSFKECNLSGTQFGKCNIEKVDFRDTSEYQIDLFTNKMKKAKFSFPEVVSLLSELDIIID